MSNPWHDVPVGKKVPDVINVVIEVPKYSNLKYELDKGSGLMKLDRALYSAVHYPGDYGFVPRTYWDDNDPLDVFVISNFPVFPRTICSVRPIGVVEMNDGKEKDDKIIGVHDADPRFRDVKSIKDIEDHMMLEITHFFETYKQLQNMEVKVLSVKGAAQAKSCIKRGIKLYNKKFPDK